MWKFNLWKLEKSSSTLIGHQSFSSIALYSGINLTLIYLLFMRKAIRFAEAQAYMNNLASITWNKFFILTPNERGTFPSENTNLGNFGVTLLIMKIGVMPVFWTALHPDLMNNKLPINAADCLRERNNQVLMPISWGKDGIILFSIKTRNRSFSLNNSPDEHKTIASLFSPESLKIKSNFELPESRTNNVCF